MRSRPDNPYRPVENHSGARGNTLAGPPKHFREASLEIFLTFFKWCILVYFIYFWATAGPPNVARPGVAYPPTTLSTGLPSTDISPLLRTNFTDIWAYLQFLADVRSSFGYGVSARLSICYAGIVAKRHVRLTEKLFENVKRVARRLPCGAKSDL